MLVSRMPCSFPFFQSIHPCRFYVCRSKRKRVRKRCDRANDDDERNQSNIEDRVEQNQELVDRIVAIVQTGGTLHVGVRALHVGRHRTNGALHTVGEGNRSSRTGSLARRGNGRKVRRRDALLESGNEVADGRRVAPDVRPGKVEEMVCALYAATVLLTAALRARTSLTSWSRGTG